MKTTKTILVEKEVTTWKCDFCDTQTDNNKGCCGSSQIMTCHFCGKHACLKHRESYWENHFDEYPNFTTCQDCKPKIDMCVHIAKQIIGRYDIWNEVIEQIFENLNDYKEYLEDYTPPKKLIPIDIAKLYFTDDCNDE